MQRECLIPAAKAKVETERNFESRGRPKQQGSSWRQRAASNRNATAASKFMPRTIANNRLIESFSEFLATRNVISSSSRSNQQPTAGCRRYDKLVSNPNDESRSHPTGPSLAQCHHALNFRAASIIARSNQTKERKFQKRAREDTQGGRRKRSSQQSTASRLGALFSRRSTSNKKSILLELLKAPTFLAALFSLLLVITLIVLYALSFSHHVSTTNNSSSLFSSNPVDSHQSSHRISSRDLPLGLSDKQQRQFDAGAADDDDDNDDDDDDVDEEPEQVGIPEGFGRALSVQTECGLLVGAVEDAGVVFRGIPFASPPTGERRWQRPRPIWLDPERCSPSMGRPASSGSSSSNDSSIKQNESRTSNMGMSEEGRDRRRRRRSRHCAQLDPVTNRFAGQEDCLYLDIYLPRLDQTKRLPVMVYIHGGFLAFGSSSGQLNWMRARPSARLAAALDVIVVAFNYRLQALGFMTLPQLASGGPESGTSSSSSSGRGDGNFGLWDQLTALNWIKRNIETFGGDPTNIVLFGPDSASSLVWALIGNERAQQPEEAGSTGFQLRNLFRAAWLTNPTIFYDLPYELAGQHYQRLFQNQSACLLPKEKPQDEEFAPSLRSSGSSSSNSKRPDSLKDCLMQLSAEQVLRHYLGNDHPSYRLDDQNSLPIHGIFVDQFVTVDGELVRDAFPFEPASKSKPTRCKPKDGQTNLPIISPSYSSALQKNINSSIPIGTHHYGGEANHTNEMAPLVLSRDSGASEFGPPPHNCSLPDEDFDLSDDAVDSSHPLQASGERDTIDLLIGSSAQAVEHWPCPRNLLLWTWDDFKRYVATSLNSFATDLYRRASSVYYVPKSADRANKAGGQWARAAVSPAWTYLTMVSDIRQICPINELVDNLSRGAAAGNGLSVQRYIVESSPARDGPPAAMLTKGTTERGEQRDVNEREYAQSELRHRLNERRRPKFAYHTKDLAAFFGYEFDPAFKAQTGDLKFQAEIRRTVREFVHERPAGSRGSGRGSSYSKIGMDSTKKIAVLDEEGVTRFVDKYRETECAMWRRHLGKSYAWLS